MATQPIATGSPVTYPQIVAGGRIYQLRFAHSAFFMLRQWGFQIGNEEKPIPILALAAAAAGTVNDNGKFRSAGFERVIDFVDDLLDGETEATIEGPVMEALKKVAPAAKTIGTTPEAKPEPMPEVKPEPMPEVKPEEKPDPPIAE